MWSSSLFASFHFLALGIGLGAIFMRGRYFKALSEDPSDQKSLKALLVADNFWGVAALLWLATGLARAFAGLEKGSEWYLQNPFFHLKLTLFLLVFLLDLKPMIALIKVRINKGKSTLSPETYRLFRKLNHFEAILVVVIIFVASAMARGLWPS